MPYFFLDRGSVILKGCLGSDSPASSFNAERNKVSSASRYIPHYTLEDFRRWEGDWELIDGVAISMTPSPFGPHERVISRLAFQFQSQLSQENCPCMVYTNLDWIVSTDTVIRPDLMLVCGAQPERHLERPPAVMAAVLSDTTRERDQTIKRSICHDNQVNHYLIIDPDARTVEHVSAGAAEQLVAGQTLKIHLQECGLSVEFEVAGLFD